MPDTTTVLPGRSGGVAPSAQTAHSRSTTRRELYKIGQALLFLSPSLILFAVFVFIPLVRSFWLSTRLTDPLGRPAAFVGLELYQRLFASPDFINSMERSFLLVLYTVPALLVLSMCLALLGNLRLRRIDVFRMIFACTIAVSAATASLIFRYLFHPSIGTLNYLLILVHIPPVPWLINANSALPAIAITSVWLALGLNTIILLAGMQGIPEELYESAMIDGANSRAKFRHITLPLLSPTIFFLLVIDVLAAFQIFTQIQIMTSGGPMNATNVIVYSIYRAFYFNGQYGYAAAQSIVLFFIMLVLTFIQFGVIERRVFYE
jgi:sn-glycerol 3-phosphate transport system permease protein